MDDKHLFQATSGLKTPWFVSDVKLDQGGKRLNISIGFEMGARFPCPECQALCQVHETSERVWKHLNSFEYETCIFTPAFPGYHALDMR